MILIGLRYFFPFFNSCGVIEEVACKEQARPAQPNQRGNFTEVTFALHLVRPDSPFKLTHSDYCGFILSRLLLTRLRYWHVDYRL